MVEENTLTGGFGSGVMDLLKQSDICDIQVTSIGIADEFVEHGPQDILRAKYGLDAKGIVQRVFTLFTDSERSSLPLTSRKEAA